MKASENRCRNEYRSRQAQGGAVVSEIVPATDTELLIWKQDALGRLGLKGYQSFTAEEMLSAIARIDGLKYNHETDVELIKNLRAANERLRVVREKAGTLVVCILREGCHCEEHLTDLRAALDAAGKE